MICTNGISAHTVNFVVWSELTHVHMQPCITRAVAAIDQERSHLCPTLPFTAEARRGKKCPFKRQLLHHTHEKVRKQVTVRHTDYKRLALMVLILRGKDIDTS